eukprot:12710974-Ditylum_brightwellii.AAC.1
MTYALNYYTVRKNSEVWGQEAAKEQLVILSVTFDELQESNLHLARSVARNKPPKRNNNKSKNDKGKGKKPASGSPLTKV